jgi:hypothetical protein
VVWVRKEWPSAVLADGTVPPQRVVVLLRQGGEESFELADADARRLLLELLTRLPWALSGSDRHWQEAWRASPETVLTAVEEERCRFLSLPPEARGQAVQERLRLAEGESDRRQG